MWDELTQDAQHIVRLHIIIGRLGFDVAPLFHLKISIFKYETALFDVLPAAQYSHNVKQGRVSLPISPHYNVPVDVLNTNPCHEVCVCSFDILV